MQVQLQHMYEFHYQADPSNRTPPIPTTQLKMHNSPERDRQLCYLAEPTARERKEVKQKLLHAVLGLEHAVPLGHPVRSMVEGSSSQWMGSYIIKREFSECSRHVFGIELPDLTPSSLMDNGRHDSRQVGGQQHSSKDFQHSTDSAARVHSSPEFDSHAYESNVAFSINQSVAPNSAARAPKLSFMFDRVQTVVSTLANLFTSAFHIGSTCVCAAPVTHGEAAMELQPLNADPSDLATGALECVNPDVATAAMATAANTASPASAASNDTNHSSAHDGGRVHGQMALTPELDSLLDATADRLLHASCGEGWLVQPRIANMSGLEYRVYMFGGASAVSFPALLSTTAVLVLPVKCI